MNNKRTENKANVIVVTVTSLIIYILLMILCINDMIASYSPLGVTLISISFGFYMIGLLIIVTPRKFYNIIYKIFHKNLAEGYYQINISTYENNKFYAQSGHILLNMSYILLIIVLLI